MLNKLRFWLQQAFRKSRTLNNEPLNKVSLVVLIIVDLFILVNVFSGLDDIGQWYLSPEQRYPCYGQWQQFQQDSQSQKRYQIIDDAIIIADPTHSYQTEYRQAQSNHLGKVSATCLQYGGLKDKVNSKTNQALLREIQTRQSEVRKLDEANSNILNQYDSTLLEKIAGQSPDRSINAVGADKAKQQLEQNSRQIQRLEKEIANLKRDLLNQSSSLTFLALLEDKTSFIQLQKDYQTARFWYPSLQLLLQVLFLAPLILVALGVHRLAQRQNYGLVALISWHLLVIFSIPLLLRVFQFLQIGFIFQGLFDLIQALVGELLFLVNYIYILLIPLLGFAIIKFSQRVIFNPKRQAANRIQQNRCFYCAKKLRPTDRHCPHCGQGQYQACEQCHCLTYSVLPYCRKCGHSLLSRR
ncbi:hypothetical protein [Synechocystis sp. LKSZ1]|uniref:hypothetical protein n=1 Tax=Synechocystis sp. LKSZ1 TaxID=3144951 RepID=UPI00336BDA2A